MWAIKGKKLVIKSLCTAKANSLTKVRSAVAVSSFDKAICGGWSELGRALLFLTLLSDAIWAL